MFLFGAHLKIEFCTVMPLKMATTLLELILVRWLPPLSHPPDRSRLSDEYLCHKKGL